MLEDYFFKKNTKWVLWGAFAVVVALLIFHAGVVVGSHQPARGRQFSNDPGMLGAFMPKNGYVESGHGAVGTIAAIMLPTFTLNTRGGMNEKIYAGTSTMVTGGTAPDTSALAQGQTVIVVGDPEGTGNGEYLEAHIIHILVAPPPSSSQPSSPPTSPIN